ncbi:MAG: response regulator [Pseudomonadota bacterium]
MTKDVLVVEDEDSIAYALQFLIEREGHSFRRAADAASARSEIADKAPDLILLDVMLPGGSGYEICQEVRLDPALEGVKIIVLTASGDAMARRKSLALGADAFIAKPFANDELQGAMARLMADAAA